jgi:hypothetical protein
MSIDKLVRALRNAGEDFRFVTRKRIDGRYYVDGNGDLFEAFDGETDIEAYPAVTGLGITEELSTPPLFMENYDLIFRTERDGYVAKEGASFYLVWKLLGIIPIRLTEGGHFIARDENGKVHTGYGAAQPRYYGEARVRILPLDSRDIAEKLS